MDTEFQCLVSFVLGGGGGLAKMVTSFVFRATLNFMNGPLEDLIGIEKT